MEPPSPMRPCSSRGLKLFFLGFTSLFLELVLIRYLAGSIWNLGYFPNLVLLAAFAGMGLGFVFHQAFPDRLSPILYHAAFFVLLLLVVLVSLTQPGVPGFSGKEGNVAGELYFTALPGNARTSTYSSFLLCFFLTLLIFALLSQRTAKLFRFFKPLTAYTLDIAGSCLGILCFAISSWMELPAFAWFILFTPAFAAALPGSWKTRWIPLLPGLALVLFTRCQDFTMLAGTGEGGEFKILWSPYQKVEYLNRPHSPHRIFVNRIYHQRMDTEPQIRNSFYQTPYLDRERRQKLPPYQKVLVLGAGAGNDVAAALLNRAEHVDAVEIDPAIASLGKKHHPCRPYEDPRVRLIVDDGRAFMTHAAQTYDLIVFALTDSLVKASPMTQLRLENYLFTVQSIQKAFRLLTETGDLVFYNSYRQPWLVDKIRKLVIEAVGLLPRIIFQEGDFIVIKAHKAGPRSGAVPQNLKELDTPTDDWPFLYLKRKGIPSLYGTAMLGTGVLVLLLLFILHRSTGKREGYRETSISTKLAFVFMGLAFLLLEAKSVIQFSLLFGTTWLNNSLVFLAVLLLILAANWTALLFKNLKKVRLIYLLLLLSSLSTLAFPLGNLLELESSLLRFGAASLLTFSPVFFANLLFSLVFKEQKIAEHLFGWNLVGATLGGIAEYSSMALGYSLLVIFVAFFYTLVFLLLSSRPANEGERSPQ